MAKRKTTRAESANLRTVLLTERAVDLKAVGDKKPRVRIVAYTGGVIEPHGWAPVVIDLAGMSIPDRVAVLVDHDSSLDGIAGQGTAQVVGRQLIVAATLTKSADVTRRVVALAGDGFEFQASVGAAVIAADFLREGETAEVNGQTFTAGKRGLTVARKTALAEVSITALGADGKSSVAISAAKRGKNMAKRKPGQRTPPADPPANPDQIRQQERDRIAAIDATVAGDWGEQAAQVAQLRARAIEGELTHERLQEEILGLIRASRGAAPAPSRHPNNGAAIYSRQTLEAAMLLRAGHAALVEREYGGPMIQAARALRASTFADMCATALELEGRNVPHDRNDMIRASFSTTSLPVALSNVTGRALVEPYQEMTSTWRKFARVLPAADFKPQTGVRPSFAGQLEQVAADGELKHGQLAESTYPWSIDTFGKMLKITRKDVINDDLGFLEQTAPNMGRMAARAVNDLVFGTIMANAGNFFHDDNGNLLDDDAELGLASLAAAVAIMRKQRDKHGNDIDILPRVLVVPPELEVTARAILNSAEIQAAEGAPTGNALASVAELAVESRLSNDDKFPNADPENWYLFGGPNDAPVIVGFLDGRDSPIVEFFDLDHDINTLGVGWRVYHDFGCALGDFKAAVKAEPTNGG